MRARLLIHWSRCGRLLAVLLLVAGPVAARAHAQDAGVPQELTVSELREVLQFFTGMERTRQMLGLPPNADLDALQVTLLEADFDENVLPGLEFAEQDCFFAEVPVSKALNWSRDVQLLGAADELGPLWLEASIVEEKLFNILLHCHKQIYERCLLDDSDPNAEFLPGITRQLILMGGDPVHEDLTNRCSIGWTGTITSTETLNNVRSKVVGAGQATVETRVVLDGRRELRIEKEGKVAGATGTVNGRNQQVNVNIARGPECTATTEMTQLRTAEGSGESTLHKYSTDVGALTLQFAGPLEMGAHATTGRITYSGSKCGANSDLPDTRVPTPSAPWPGMLTDTLSDPFTEVISGSRTLVWVLNDAGLPTPANDSATGVSRIPAIPGLTAPSIASQMLPWLAQTQAQPGLDGEPPTIRMEVTWNLAFGGAR